MSDVLSTGLGARSDPCTEHPPSTALRDSVVPDSEVTPTQFETRLQHGPEAPRLARGALAEWMNSALHPEVLDTARLLTSELVTNAVVHGTGEIVLRAQLAGDRLRVGVSDRGTGFVPTILDPPPDRSGLGDPPGLGMKIVAAMADCWGIRETPTQVWFELRRRGAQSR